MIRQAFICIVFCGCCGLASALPNSGWTGTWTGAPQWVEPANMPPQPGLSHNTLRQVVRVSLGGDSLRVRLSNAFSNQSVELIAAHIAVSAGGTSIDAPTNRALTFSNLQQVQIPPGEDITSDPIAFPLAPRMDVAITLCFGDTPSEVTGHPGSRTTSYLTAGHYPAKPNLTHAVHTDHWYYISGIDVKNSRASGAVVVLGNSITDGRGSGTNRQNRWPDILSERLLRYSGSDEVAILNQALGGNCVLGSCVGPSALERFDRDVLSQTGVRWLIILEGINDIGQAPSDEDAVRVARALTTAYAQMIDKAHAAGIRVYGATLLPFGRSFYFTEVREEARQEVNEWIRNSGRFDGVIDFDRTMSDPTNPTQIASGYHTGDFLHPNEEGYKKMGESIDLELFIKKTVP